MKQKPQYDTSIRWDATELVLSNAKWRRYRRCQAWTLYVGGELWIKSYQTLVAVISSTGGLSIRGYYSRTTSAHITKIYRSYKHGKLDR